MRILIIGIVASGKSTLATKLSKQLNIKHYEIDLIVHDDENKKMRSHQEQLDIINEIDKNEDWIIEGTLRKNLYILLDLAEKIIYLDIPLRVRKRRILIRHIKQNLGLEKCGYKPNREMLKKMYKWTDDFEKNKVQFEENINKYKDKLIISNNANIREILKKLEN